MTDDQHPIPQQATWRHTGGRIWHVVWDGASDTETGRATARFHRAPTPDSRPVWNGKAWTWDPQPVRAVPDGRQVRVGDSVGGGVGMYCFVQRTRPIGGGILRRTSDRRD